MEKLREYLGVVKWIVLGGCWGATLALSYALKHPNAVKALILGGIFTLRRYNRFHYEAKIIYNAVVWKCLRVHNNNYFREELEWLFQEGVSFMFPDKWEKFIEPIPEVERGDLLSAYHRR